MNQVAEILEWFKLAVPEPTDANKCIQIGCHYEEAHEMAEALGEQWIANELYDNALHWKNADNDGEDVDFLANSGVNKNGLLDALCDQIVTAIGVAHMYGFDIVGALQEVNRSNFSKFVDGKPVFNEQGKIKKGPDYTPPVLDKFLGE